MESATAERSGARKPPGATSRRRFYLNSAVFSGASHTGTRGIVNDLAMGNFGAQTDTFVSNLDLDGTGSGCAEGIDRGRVGDWVGGILMVQTEMVDDLVDDRRIGNERDDAHGSAAFGTKEGIIQPDLPKALSLLKALSWSKGRRGG